MSAQKLDTTEEQLQRAKRVLDQSAHVVDRIITALKPTEQALLLKEFQNRTTLDPGESKVVLCIEEELAISKSFKKALSKLRKKTPTLVKIPDENTSRLTNLTVARMIPTEVLANDDEQVLVVNIQKERMLKHLEKAKTVIIGDRYALDFNNTISKLEETLEKMDVSVQHDLGLHGGGSLTYELVRALRGRPKSTVLEITLSCEVADSSDTLQRMMESLLSL